MAKPRKTQRPPASRPLKNQRRTRISFAEAVSSANQRAHEKANRKGGRRGKQFVWAAVADAEAHCESESGEWMKRIWRWSLALLLLPLCWVTSWTFLSRFSQAAVYQDFWKTAEFWYFATGALVMVGWFWSGLLKSFFLYLYVLGHELTHVVFVLIYRGKVMDFHVSTGGGYITTNKTNLIIALSPYFVPFWSVVSALCYVALRYFAGLSAEWDRLLYAVMGVTWTFHMVWTLWMIPRDQPDLKENGTFLSLVIIYLANLLVLVALLCLAAESPVENTREFAMEWIRHAATWGDLLLRMATDAVAELRAASRL
jgi:hypothetical protein